MALFVVLRRDLGLVCFGDSVRSVHKVLLLKSKVEIFKDIKEVTAGKHLVISIQCYDFSPL